MTSKRICRIALFLILTLAQSILPASGRAVPGYDDVPGERLFRIELLSRISTATNQKGDKFDCRVLEPKEFAGAIVSGQITKLKRSGKVDGKSEMNLAFGMITFPDGSKYRYGAQVVEVHDIDEAAHQGKADDEGTLKARSARKRDALKIGAGAVIGAVLGAILGGAKGAAIGSALGAAFGATSVLTSKGPDLEFKPGTQFVVKTDKRRYPSSQ